MNLQFWDDYQMIDANVVSRWLTMITCSPSAVLLASSERMRNRKKMPLSSCLRAFFVGGIIAGVVCGRGAAIAAPQRPPDGTYHYVAMHGTAKVGESTITVRGSSHSVAVNEAVTLGPARATIASTYDAETLRQTTYVMDAMVNGYSQHAVVSPLPNGVTIRVGQQVVDVQAAPDAPLVLVADNFVNSMFMLAPIITLDKPQAITEAVLAGAKSVRTTITNTRPGVISADLSGLQIRYAYDVATLVLQEVNVPAQNLVISLVH